MYSKSNVSSIDLSTGSVLHLQLPDCSDIIALGSLGDRNVVFTKQVTSSNVDITQMGS